MKRLLKGLTKVLYLKISLLKTIYSVNDSVDILLINLEIVGFHNSQHSSFKFLSRYFSLLPWHNWPEGEDSDSPWFCFISKIFFHLIKILIICKYIKLCYLVIAKIYFATINSILKSIFKSICNWNSLFGSKNLIAEAVLKGILLFVNGLPRQRLLGQKSFRSAMKCNRRPYLCLSHILYYCLKNCL